MAVTGPLNEEAVPHIEKPQGLKVEGKIIKKMHVLYNLLKAGNHWYVVV